MRPFRWFGVAAVLWLGAGGVLAAPQDAPVKDAAPADPLAAAVAAVEAAPTGDAAALRAALGEQDPWLVVDALRAKERLDLAGAVADTVTTSDGPMLRTLAGRPLREPSGVRRRLEETVRAWRVEKTLTAAQALTALGGGEALPDSVLRVRWSSARGLALSEVKRAREAATTLSDGAELAARLGWLSRAATLWGLAGRQFSEAHDLERAARAWVSKADALRTTNDAVGRAQTLANVGLAYRKLGDVARSRRAYDEAAEALGAGDVPTRATILLDRATAAAIGGDFAGAFADLAAARSLLDDDEPPPARRAASAEADVKAHVALANLFNRLGDVTRARATLALARRTVDDDAAWDTPTTDAAGRVASTRAFQRSVIRGAEAVCDLLDGAYERADATLTEVMAAFLAMPDPRNAGRAQQNRGEVALRRGQWTEAKFHSTGASAALKDVGDAEGELLALGNLGAAVAGLGDEEEAERIHEGVLERAAKLGLRSLVLEQCVRLARLRLALGEEKSALRVVERGTDVLTGLYGGLPDADRVGARAGFADLFDVGLQIAAARGDEAQFFRWLESGRAGALVDGLANRGAAVRAVDPDLADRLAEQSRRIAVARAQRRAVEIALDVAYPQGAPLAVQRAQLEPVRLAVEEAKRAHQETVAEAQRRHRAASHPEYPRPDTMADAMRGLGPDEAVVEYVAVGDAEVAFVLTRDGARRVGLGPRDAVAALDAVEAWRDVVGTPAEAEGAATSALERARALVWAPVEAVLPPSVRRVYASPDPALRRVPFSALAERGRGLSVLYTPSATVLSILRADAAARGSGTLAFGVSKYDAPRALASVFRDRWSLGDLPRAAAEARAIGGASGDLWRTDAEATETELRAIAATRRRWRAVHFACHGVVDLLSPSLSAIALRPTVEDDGFVTAVELLECRLSADVVTLSACNTGWGRDEPGEGIVSLARAFLLAGSPRVVASLWPVEDTSADAFMRAFHAAWRDGASAEDAMRAGVKAVRADPRHQHPRYWAAWVLWGVGGEPSTSPAQPRG